MKDFLGNDLQIGDKVVFVYGKNSGATLLTGTVTKFYTNKYGKDECSVDSNTHIISSRIMKL